jgi:hypothetical protein
MADDAGGATDSDGDVREAGDPADAPGAAADFLIVDDTEDAAPTQEDTTEGDGEPDSRPLNAARVRQLAALRRGAYRSRSYFFVAIAICVVAEGQLVLMTVRYVHAFGWQPRPVGYLSGVVAAMMAAAFLLRRAAELTRELRTRPTEAEAPPDFSTLSDGSHAWKNLEQMREGS